MDPGIPTLPGQQLWLPLSSPTPALLTPKQREEAVALLARLLREAMRPTEANDENA